MSKENNIVIVAAYLSLEPATKNFELLTQQAKEKKIRTDGMILVQKDLEGKLSVLETGDHLGRKGMGWGGGVGLLVGMVSGALLAPVLIGAAAGAALGKLAKKKVESGLEKGLGENLKPGNSVILAIVEEDDKLAAEQALANSPAKSVAVIDKAGVKGLKEALGEAAGKFNPDRTVLPIPDKAFSGVAGHTLDNSVADWSMIPHAKAPEEAPNVLIVLIDDAGFAGPSRSVAPSIRPPSPASRRWGWPITASTSSPCAHRHEPHCSPAATSTVSAWDRLPSIPARSRAIRPLGHAVVLPYLASCRRTVMSPAVSASGI